MIGAGLAGCWLASELTGRGRRAVLIDRRDGPGRAASGNRVGVIKPFVTRESGAAEAFHAAAFDHLLARLLDARLANASRLATIGVLQLVERGFDERDDVVTLDPGAASARAGVSLDTPALHFERGGWLDPSRLCAALLEGTDVDRRFGVGVTSLESAGNRWQLALDDGSVLQAGTLVLASGAAIGSTRWTAHLPVTPARGQMDRFEAGDIATPRTVISARRWLIPDDGGISSGASYARDDLDETIRSSDSADNRAALRSLCNAEPGSHVDARAGVRATTPDRLPLVGPIATPASLIDRYADLWRGRRSDAYESAAFERGLAVLGGFGSRGIVTGALSASLLAGWLSGDDLALQRWNSLLAPHRFLIRDALKGRLQGRAPGP